MFALDFPSTSLTHTPEIRQRQSMQAIQLSARRVFQGMDKLNISRLKAKIYSVIGRSQKRGLHLWDQELRLRNSNHPSEYPTSRSRHPITLRYQHISLAVLKRASQREVSIRLAQASQALAFEYLLVYTTLESSFRWRIEEKHIT